MQDFSMLNTCADTPTSWSMLHMDSNLISFGNKFNQFTWERPIFVNLSRSPSFLWRIEDQSDNSLGRKSLYLGMLESAMQDMMNFWPGPVDICSKKISAYFLFCVESFWDSNSYGEILAPACKWGVVAGSQSSVLTTTLLVMDRVSEGHLVTLIVRDMFFVENLLSETHRKGELCVWNWG